MFWLTGAGEYRIRLLRRLFRLLLLDTWFLLRLMLTLRYVSVCRGRLTLNWLLRRLRMVRVIGILLRVLVMCFTRACRRMKVLTSALLSFVS